MTCPRCNRDVAKRAAVTTRTGVLCPRCADKLPRYLHRPPRPARKGEPSP